MNLFSDIRAVLTATIDSLADAGTLPGGLDLGRAGKRVPSAQKISPAAIGAIAATGETSPYSLPPLARPICRC